MASHPDADICPNATGPAQDVVQRHLAEQPIKLYAGWFCPFVQRVWVAFEEKQIPYQYIEVNPYIKPESLLSLNPRCLVPTLVCPALQSDGSTALKPLYESTVIIEYLDEAFPDPERPLHPADSYQKARGRIWMDFVTTRILPSYYRFMLYQGSDEGLTKAREELLDHLKTFTLAMDELGPFFHGKNFMLPDIVLAPFATRFWALDQYKKGGFQIPAPEKGGKDDAIWNRWRKWMAEIETRPSIASTTSDKEHYHPIYKRYADNLAQSELAKATRAGRGVP